MNLRIDARFLHSDRFIDQPGRLVPELFNVLLDLAIDLYYFGCCENILTLFSIVVHREVVKEHDLTVHHRSENLPLQVVLKRH